MAGMAGTAGTAGTAGLGDVDTRRRRIVKKNFQKLRIYRTWYEKFIIRQTA